MLKLICTQINQVILSKSLGGIGEYMDVPFDIDETFIQLNLITIIHVDVVSVHVTEQDHTYQICISIIYFSLFKLEESMIDYS